MRSRRFDEARIAYLREVPVLATLDALGIYWKRDASFEPLKDKATVRVHVSLGGAVVELLATGAKWYDTRTERGGGGAIDLAMYLLRLDFVTAVKRLQVIPSQPTRIA
ncbi:hypothetical protein MC126_004528 [Salmonella enterica]|nr:hypothetical protein [Salmonella enterica]ELO8195548.1 hypothetical protein [Salmonella enterica]